MFAKNLCLILTIWALLACNHSEPEQPIAGVCANGIVGGTSLSEADPMAQRVALLKSDDSSCTATPISERVLLTAAHCVLGKKNLRVIFGTNECGSDLTSQARPVVRMKIHEEFNPHAFGGSDLSQLKNDVALVRIEGAMPEGIISSRIYDGRSSLSSPQMTAVGYGDEIESSRAEPRLRMVSKNIRRDLSLSNKSSQVYILDQKEGGVCTGDSGGPQFVSVRGEYQIFAINSGLVGEQGRHCHGVAYLMAMPKFQRWIDEGLQSLR